MRFQRSVLLTVIAWGAGCEPSNEQSKESVRPLDAWYTDEHPSGSDISEFATPRKWTQLEREHFGQVRGEHLAEAEKLLQDAPAVELTLEQATRFLEKLPKAPAGTKPYLVRGLVLYRGTGNFTLYTSGTQLYVHHGSLGHELPPQMRQPLIAFLGFAPSKVFVACSLAR